MERALQALDTLSEILKKSCETAHHKPKQHVAFKKSHNIAPNGTGYGGEEDELDTIGENRAEASNVQSVDDKKIEQALKLVRNCVPVQLDAPTSEILHSLQRSAGLRWTMKYLLVNDSLLDIGDRVGVYRALLSLIKVISREPFAVPYFLHIPSGEEHSVRDMMRALSEQSRTFLSLYQNQTVQNGEDDDDDDMIMSAAMLIAMDITETYDILDSGCVNATELGLVQSTRGSAPVADTAAVKSVASGRKRRNSSASSSEPVLVETNKSDNDYITCLRPLRFEAISLCDMVESGLTSHSFLGKNAAKYLQSSSGHSGVVGDARKRLVRVACEMSGLSSSLPVELGSSVFVRCDESRMDVLKALVVGPEDTPYANGLFEFDILLPPAYPAVPPQVLLVTTGGGTVRFNPNLYDCGKVCLSLLGTWEGPGWDAKESTLLQVLVSIQSLILVPDPYFNEPGFEQERSVPSTMRQSEEYSADIRVHTLRHAILEAMTKPSPVFRDVVLRHFYHKRHSIATQLQEWLNMIVPDGGDGEEEEHNETSTNSSSSSSSSGKGKAGKQKKGAAIKTAKKQQPNHYRRPPPAATRTVFAQIVRDTEAALEKLVQLYEAECAAADAATLDSNNSSSSSSSKSSSAQQSGSNNNSSVSSDTGMRSSKKSRVSEVVSLLDDDEDEDGGDADGDKPVAPVLGPGNSKSDCIMID